jgi:hypothetical protein
MDNFKAPVFTREYVQDDRSVVTWYYDVAKNKRGPWKVEIEYAKLTFEEEQEFISLKRRKYKHPETEKLLSYRRALKLELITPEGKILPYVHTNKKKRRIKEKGNADILDRME